MEKAQEILFHLDELYNETPSEFRITQACKANPARYQMWVDAFKDYDLTDVLISIDEYWEFKNSKTKPNVAQIKAILNAKKTEKQKEVSTESMSVAQCGDFAWERMNADIEAGCCRNNLYVYRDAERIVLNEWLVEYLPLEVVRKMSYGAKVKQAMEKGLFNNFDDAMKQAAQARFGREFEFLCADDLENQQRNDTAKIQPQVIGKTLAAHWKMGA